MSEEAKDNIFTLVKALAVSIMLCVPLVMGFLFFKDLHTATMNMSEVENLKNSVYVGTIVDKQIKNASHGLLSSTDMEYRIYIEAYFTYDEKDYKFEKYFNVPMDVYLSYNIGETFDSHNFKTISVNINGE